MSKREFAVVDHHGVPVSDDRYGTDVEAHVAMTAIKGRRARAGRLAGTVSGPLYIGLVIDGVVQR